MVKDASAKLQSSKTAVQLGQGSTGVEQSFSLVMSKEWMKAAELHNKDGSQHFYDLHTLIKNGIPNQLRVFIWQDLMKSKMLEMDARQRMLKAYEGMIDKSKATYTNFVEIAENYDCVAFRQIDQDIGEFRFPAHYYTETID